MVPRTFQKIIEGALSAVDPVKLIRDNIRIEGHRLFIKHRPFDLTAFKNIHVLGVGKGATFMFQGVDEILGDRLTGGIIVSLPAHAFEHPRIRSMPGSHPVPDRSSLVAGEAISNYVRANVRPRDLVLFLITGGASALMVQPAPGLQLEDKMELNRLLLDCGADITEINCVRKSMSAIKGGKLAQLAHPARMISLILSDVIDSPLGDIGSGPSITTPSNVGSAYYILKKYHLLDQLSPQVNNYFTKALEHENSSDKSSLAQTHPGLQENAHFLLADNRIALEAAKETAQSLDFKTVILTSRDKGEASEAAKLYSAVIKEIMYTRTPFEPPVLLLCGGELTVTMKSVRGKRIGKGGRNQAFILHLLKELKTIAKPYFMASLGTDGIDGPTDAAGAWIDQDTMSKVKELNLSIDGHLDNFDSYTFFQRLDQLIKTGPTRTNVMDLRMFYISKR